VSTWRPTVVPPWPMLVAVPARCDLRGFLLIGDNDRLPAMGPYGLPGNNYHVYDYALFWANIRADAERRVAAFEARGTRR